MRFTLCHNAIFLNNCMHMQIHCSWRIDVTRDADKRRRSFRNDFLIQKVENIPYVFASSVQHLIEACIQIMMQYITIMSNCFCVTHVRKEHAVWRKLKKVLEKMSNHNTKLRQPHSKKKQQNIHQVSRHEKQQNTKIPTTILYCIKINKQNTSVMYNISAPLNEHSLSASKSNNNNNNSKKN